MPESETFKNLFLKESELNDRKNQSKSEISQLHTLETRIHCAHGLAELALSKYKSAAMRFLDCSFDSFDNADLMSLQNVATYGGLCAMASLNRTELYEKVKYSLSKMANTVPPSYSNSL